MGNFNRSIKDFIISIIIVVILGLCQSWLYDVEPQSADMSPATPLPLSMLNSQR